jgi:hypothetical protein
MKLAEEIAAVQWERPSRRVFAGTRQQVAWQQTLAVMPGVFALNCGKVDSAVKNYRIVAPLLLLVMIALSGQLLAQSTIFNIPTTDTVSKGKAYAEFDFLPEVPGIYGARIYLYNPRLVIGAPKNFEFGVNFPIYHTRSMYGSFSNGYIQPNAKVRFYNSDKEGVALAAGFLWNTPLNNRRSQDSWGLVYGLVSKKIKSSEYGPRFHAGAYGVVSANQDATKGAVSFLGPRGGAILGYEQPTYKRLSIVADWYSGKNGLGYFTPGVSITLPKNGLLNAGYSFGNDSWADSNATRNRYFFLYYGVTF